MKNRVQTKYGYAKIIGFNLRFLKYLIILEHNLCTTFISGQELNHYADSLHCTEKTAV